jgi:hypothetical protein
LWFVDGGDVERIPCTIESFSADRHADLWAGIGLSSTYAGGVDESALRHLHTQAEEFQPMLAQGSAFASEARLRAGNMTPQTELACGVLTGVSSQEAAAMTEAARQNLPTAGQVPAFQVWKERIQEHWRKCSVVT